MINDYSLKKIKTIIINYDFNFKPKIIISDYDFNFLNKFKIIIINYSYDIGQKTNNLNLIFKTLII